MATSHGCYRINRQFFRNKNVFDLVIIFQRTEGGDEIYHNLDRCFRTPGGPTLHHCTMYTVLSPRSPVSNVGRFSVFDLFIIFQRITFFQIDRHLYVVPDAKVVWLEVSFPAAKECRNTPAKLSRTRVIYRQ